MALLTASVVPPSSPDPPFPAPPTRAPNPAVQYRPQTGAGSFSAVVVHTELNMEATQHKGRQRALYAGRQWKGGCLQKQVFMSPNHNKTMRVLGVWDPTITGRETPVARPLAAADRQASDRQASDCQASDRQAADRTVADRTTADRTTADRTTADCTAADRTTADRTTAD
eukprot:7702904-Pyramimonas_sp.AAC.1